MQNAERHSFELSADGPETPHAAYLQFGVIVHYARHRTGKLLWSVGDKSVIKLLNLLSPSGWDGQPSLKFNTTTANIWVNFGVRKRKSRD